MFIYVCIYASRHLFVFMVISCFHFFHFLPLCIIYVCCHFPARMAFCLTGVLLTLFDLILRLSSADC